MLLDMIQTQVQNKVMFNLYSELIRYWWLNDICIRLSLSKLLNLLVDVMNFETASLSFILSRMLNLSSPCNIFKTERFVIERVSFKKCISKICIVAAFKEVMENSFLLTTYAIFINGNYFYIYHFSTGYNTFSCLVE